MDIRQRLLTRTGINDIREILFYIRQNDRRKEELYRLLFDEDDTVSYQAAWTMCHFTANEHRWLYSRQRELIDALLACEHAGKRRLLLSLIFRQPQTGEPHAGLIDFCMQRMFSHSELPGVKSICIKLAYELCRTVPELLREYALTLELADENMLPPSLKTVRKNVFAAMKKGKSLPGTANCRTKISLNFKP